MSFDYCSGVDHPHNNINSRNNDGMVMMSYNNQSSSPGCSSDEDVNNAAINTSGSDVEELRRGPWTGEEDIALINYIAVHGEGRWNSLARCAGLNRTGKSCRLRWLNYLRPDVRRGNITPEEQLLILELHSRWGNRWSKIAQYLPGRTDNEIKNYWRTRVQKHAKQLKCDVNSQQFKDTMRYLWMPRLVERIQASAAAASSTNSSSSINTAGHFPPQLQQQQQQYHHHQAQYSNNMITNHYSGDGDDGYNNNNLHFSVAPPPCEHLSNMTSDNASTSSSMGNQLVLSPVSTAACGGGGGGGGGSDYYTYAAPGDAAPSMYDFQPVDQNINPNSSGNNYFNQNLAKASQPPIGFDHFQWLLDDDVHLQGGGDYHTPGDVHVDVNLWNSVDDVNSYDQLLQHQRQLQQQFHDSTNNNCVYF